MSDQRRAGLIQLAVGGVIQDAKGEFTYGLGAPKLTAHYGPTGELQGYSSTTTPGFIEGKITDRSNLDLAELFALGGTIGGNNSLTITLSLANGKTIVLRNAGWTGEGTASHSEAEIPVRWEGSCQELKHS